MRRFLIGFACLLLVATDVTAQPYDADLLKGLDFRMVGPFRGGRSTAVTGLTEKPHTFWMGTTGGGVWKTDDAGTTWHNISDKYFGGSVGGIDVADTDPALIVVGTGSADIRGNTSTGRGVWRSEDGGKTWQFAGLEDSGQISRVVIHPTNPDRVYVAALGHPFGKNDQRGVFRSDDGGKTWDNVLFVDDSTGVSSLAINPQNPRELLAGLWRGQRTPWSMISGGPNGGVYHSTDGGDTWTKLGGGLPTGVVGKVGVEISPADPDRMYALVEAEPEGGLYRSDDGGKSWTRVNSENKLRQRAWYYTHVRADPVDPHTVYALNTSMYRSVDGGVTFTPISVPHGDVHDLWINPENTAVMGVANDGGAQATLNGGKTWSTYYNQPTAELYGVVVDDAFPYRLYGAQQDNTTISVPSWSSSNTLYPKEEWLNVGGCETGPIALHPDHPETIYAGCYGGVIDRYDRTRDQVRNVILYPQLQLGETGKNLKYRFQWNAPMAVSPHDPNTVYHGSQYVHITRDGGMTWDTISPDLTTNTPFHQERSGGPINADITGVEIFNTVYSIAPSPHDANTLWVGTDDGRVHVTRDHGASWQDITPPGMPQWGTVNRIDVSAHAPGRAFLAVHAYRLDDFAPYIFRTDDFGRTWTRITDGIPADYPVRVVREDYRTRGLLFAGTEFGLFVSFDDGAHWQPLQNDLPITPITDLQVWHGDVVMSTQGRSFWMLDDIYPLRQLSPEVAASDVHLFRPREAYRVNNGGSNEEFSPEPHPGATMHYWLADSLATPVTLDILDGEGRLVRSFSNDSAASKKARTPMLKTGRGLHRIAWDRTYAGPNTIDGAVIWGYTGGIKAPPGWYTVRLTAAGQTQEQQLELRADPRLDNVSAADYAAQFELAVEVRDAMNDVFDAIRTVRRVRTQAETMAELADDATLEAQADALAEKLTALENRLMQTKNQSGQDPIRFAPRLDNQFVELYNYVTGPDGYIAGGAEGRPTAGAYERFGDLQADWAAVRADLQRVLQTDVEAFNDAYARLGRPAIDVSGGGER